MDKIFRHGLMIILGCFTTTAFAQSKADSLLSVIQATQEPEKKVSAYIVLMEYYEDSQIDSAQKYANLAYQLADRSGLDQEMADLALKKAQYFIMLGQYGDAASQYDAVLPRIEALGNPETEATYYGDRGIMNFYKGDFKEALRYFQNALALAVEHELADEQMRFLNANALALSYLGRAEEGIVIHEQAIELAAAMGDSVSMARSLNNIGLIYDDMEEYERALAFYQRALEIKEKFSSESEIINSLYNVANMKKEFGEIQQDTALLEQAKSSFEEILVRSKKLNAGKLILSAKFGLAQLETSFENYEQAISIYEEVIEQASLDGDEQVLRVSQLNVGINYLSLGNAADALKNLKAAEKAIVESANPSDLSRLYFHLSLAYEKLKQPLSALTYYKKYQAQQDLMSNERLQNNLADFEVKYETQEKEAALLKQKATLAEQELALKTKNNTLIVLSATILLVVLAGYLIYSQQKQKQVQMAKEAALQTALARIETQNKMQEQRLRISRDLHDNIGSQLTFIISSIDNLKYGLKTKSMDVIPKLADITGFTRSTINDLRDTIWAMNAERISFENLTSRLSNYLDSAREALGATSLIWEVDGSLPMEETVSSVAGVNIYRCIQEAINNAVRHGKPNTITINMEKNGDQMLVTVEDDGHGFEQSNQRMGNGLSNMKKRMADIGGSFEVNSPEEGTNVTLRFGLVADEA